MFQTQEMPDSQDNTSSPSSDSTYTKLYNEAYEHQNNNCLHNERLSGIALNTLINLSMNDLSNVVKNGLGPGLAVEVAQKLDMDSEITVRPLAGLLVNPLVFDLPVKEECNHSEDVAEKNEPLSTGEKIIYKIAHDVSDFLEFLSPYEKVSE